MVEVNRLRLVTACSEAFGFRATLSKAGEVVWKGGGDIAGYTGETEEQPVTKTERVEPSVDADQAEIWVTGVDCPHILFIEGPWGLSVRTELPIAHGEAEKTFTVDLPWLAPTVRNASIGLGAIGVGLVVTKALEWW